MNSASAAEGEWRRIVLSVLDFAGAMAGCFLGAAGLLWLIIIGSGVALFAIPRWRKPRIVVGAVFVALMFVSIVAAVLDPGIPKRRTTESAPHTRSTTFVSHA